MKFTVDRNIYSDICVSKLVYWLSGKYNVCRQLNDAEEILTINGEINNEDELKFQISQLLNDFKLREIVEVETHDIRIILYAKAFAECDDLEE